MQNIYIYIYHSVPSYFGSSKKHQLWHGAYLGTEWYILVTESPNKRAGCATSGGLVLMRLEALAAHFFICEISLSQLFPFLKVSTTSNKHNTSWEDSMVKRADN